jgi:hypothetical protein
MAGKCMQHDSDTTAQFTSQTSQPAKCLIPTSVAEKYSESSLAPLSGIEMIRSQTDSCAPFLGDEKLQSP